MANDPNLNTQGQGDGKQPKGWDTNTDTVPKKAYTTLQTKLDKANDRLKEFEKKQMEGMDVEQQLQEERTQRGILETELRTLRLKSKARPELHDFIDSFAEKYGKAPDEEDLEFFESQLPEKKGDKKSEKQTSQSSSTGENKNESSGVRNNQARTPETDAELDEILKNTRLDDIPSFAGR